MEFWEVFLQIVFGFLIVGFVGGGLGTLLAFAAKVFEVKKDEKILAITDVLPGVNCGACGFAGCGAYAEAVAAGDTSLSLCSPGGGEVIEALGSIMGTKVEGGGDTLVAQVMCTGLNAAKTAFEYQGLDDCNAAVMHFGGSKECKYGCLGHGSCMKICPSDAIYRNEDGLIVVDTKLCISCEMCIDVCPTGVMQMVPEHADLIVACNSKDKGAKVRKYCSVGCIGCKICVKKSPTGGYQIEDNLARINYNLRGDRMLAAEACPPKCIVDLNLQSVVKTVDKPKKLESDKQAISEAVENINQTTSAE